MSRSYAIYARQSIDKADSISIETQIERCLFEVGDAPYRVYSDRGFSGKNTDRPQFQQMLDAVREGKICCVVCYKLDRCSRSILDFTQLMNLFQENDVAFVSCTEKFDTATPMGRAMLNICIVFAQLERETIQQRITDAYHSRCKKGYFMGGRVPFGFSLMPCLLDGRKTACYEVMEEEAEIMRQIYTVYKDPNASLSDVVQGLQALKIANPRRPDGLWIRPHIARMIKSPIYVMADQRIYDYYLQLNAIADNPREDYIGRNGCYLYNIGEELHLVLAPHEGIIPSEVWLQCQKRKPKHQGPNRNQKPNSWLVGILRCQKCGRAVVLRHTIGKNGRIYRYFLCSASRGKDRICEGFKPFPAQKTEIAITHAILRHIQSLSTQQKTGNTGSVPAALLKNMLSGVENDSEISFEQLKQQFLQLYAQLTRPSKVNPKRWESLSERLSHWEEIPVEKKARIAQLLIETVKLTDNRVTIVWRV